MENALRFKGHCVGHCAGDKPLHHSGVVLPVDLKVQQALLAVADAVGRVRGEAHVRVLLAGKVVGHVQHADFLSGAEDDPQLPVALHAGVLQGPQAVQGHDGRPLVV